MVNEGMYSIWKKVKDTDLLNAVGNSSLYKSAKYSDFIGGKACLQNFPVLDRQELANWLAQQAFDDESIFWWKTSGTSTGKRMKIAFPKNFHKEQLDSAYGAYFPSHYESGKIHAHLCPPAISGLFVDPAGTREMRTIEDEIFLSPPSLPQHWQAEDYERIHADIKALQPTTLRFDPNFLIYYLDWIYSSGKELIKIPLLLSSYSHLTVQLRKKIEDAYGVKVVILFGMSECGPIYFDHGDRCDLWSKSLNYEVIERYSESDEAVVAEGFLSSLRNPLYPLVRYRTGDLFRILKLNGRLSSARLCGRMNNVILFPNGNESAPKNVLTQDAVGEAIKDADIRQEVQLLIKNDGIEVLVRYPVKQRSQARSVVDRVKSVLDILLRGFYNFEVRLVEHLIAEKSGKIAVIKKIER